MNIGQAISNHWAAIATTGVGGMLLNASVDAMPIKDDVMKVSSFKESVGLVYDFVYKVLHNFVSIRSGKSNERPTQPPPAA